MVSWGSGTLWLALGTLLLPLMLGGGGVLSPLSELIGILFSTIMAAGMVGLSTLLLIGVPMFIMLRLGALMAGVGVGLWASRAHRTATVTDETGRLSVAAIIASMQGSAAREEDAKPDARPVTREAL